MKTLADSLEGEGRASYDSGKLLFGDGDFAGALLKFQRAFDLSKDARLLWNMAACEKSLRHYARAVTLLDRYMSDGRDQLNADDLTEAKRLRNAIVEFTAPLAIVVSEPGATVLVDDDSVGQSPMAAPLATDIGTHKVTVTKAGFKEFSTTVVVGGASSPPVVVKLEKDIHEGKLVVTSPANASVSIDGQIVGLGTWSGTLQSGEHTLKVSAPKMHSYQTEVTVQDDQVRNVEATLEPDANPGVPAWMWITGGAVVAAGAAVGGYFLLRPKDTAATTPGTMNPGSIELP